MRWIMVVGTIVLVGILLYSSFQQTGKKYEVCMTFHGTSHCSKATGATPEEAIRSAQGIDCELVTNGRDQLMACMDQSPTSSQEVK
jgi:Na+/glutamate symporter